MWVAACVSRGTAWSSRAQCCATALTTCKRHIRTPLGGFDDVLPPSLGRPGGKGQLSTVNLHVKKLQDDARRRVRRRTLCVPAAAVAATARASLQHKLTRLLRRSAVYRIGPAHDSAAHVVTADDGDDKTAASAAAAAAAHLHERRCDQERVQHMTAEADDDDEEESVTRRRARSVALAAAPAFALRIAANTTATTQPMCVDAALAPRTGDEAPHRLSADEPCRISPCRREYVQESDSVGTRRSDTHAMRVVDAPPACTDEADADGDDGDDVEAIWCSEAALERHFAVSPQSTVFGSDLDRLELDMRRDHHQQHKGGALPSLDAVYTKAGAGRRSRRLRFEPSSSWDVLTPQSRRRAAAVASAPATAAHSSRDAADDAEVDVELRRRRNVCGSARNRNLSAHHMYAEAYRAQHAQSASAAAAAAAAVANADDAHSSSHRAGGGGVNLCKYAALVADDDGGVAAAAAVDKNDASSATMLQPASANPHFACDDDDDGDDDSNVNSTTDAHETATQRCRHHHRRCSSSSSGGGESVGNGYNDEHDDTAVLLDDVAPTIVVDARRDYKARLRVSAPRHARSSSNDALTTLTTTTTTLHRGGHDDDNNDDKDEDDGVLRYDAYCQRPAEAAVPVLRGVEYWADATHRQRLAAHTDVREAAVAREELSEGAVDTASADHSTHLLRKHTMLYFQAHPINEMIQDAFVRIRAVYPSDGSAPTMFTPHTVACPAVPLVAPSAAAAAATTTSAHDEVAHRVAAQYAAQMCMDVDVPVHEARRLARELALDLIRVGSLCTLKTDRRIIAICILADHRAHMREELRFKMQKLGVQPPLVRACLEVGFRGGTHPHAIRFKSVAIAKYLLRHHSIRVNLTKFGTPREGFAVLQSILDEVKLQCLRLKAYHRAGQIQANYDEIYCYLYPSTARSPKTTVEHPTARHVRAVRDVRIAENEKELYFDDVYGQPDARALSRYMSKVHKGTAWADKDAGLSLQRQRAMKVMLGFLPKGNNELYAARGDVNVRAPFRASHLTSVDAWSYPRESNLEQARRGAAALGKRAAMHVTDMHDRDETPENATQLCRSYYRVAGPALEVGELKEAMGLKDNRKRRPPLAPGFATLGLKDDADSHRVASPAAE